MANVRSEGGITEADLTISKIQTLTRAVSQFLQYSISHYQALYFGGLVWGITKGKLTEGSVMAQVHWVMGATMDSGATWLSHANRRVTQPYNYQRIIGS